MARSKSLGSKCLLCIDEARCFTPGMQHSLSVQPAINQYSMPTASLDSSTHTMMSHAMLGTKSGMCVCAWSCAADVSAMIQLYAYDIARH